MWTIRIMPERELPPHLWRTTASVNSLIRTNDRLMVCYAVAAGIMSEGQACAHLGLDRVTFREILAAAEAWAEEAARNLETRREATGARPAGAGASEPPPAGVAGASGGVGESGGVPEP
jgi:hypothetical protein